MRRALPLLLLLLPAASPGAEAPAEKRGVLLSFGAAQWQLESAGPLAYTPFELGWAFGNGLRVQSGVDIFYYRARQLDERYYAGQGPKQFAYEMTDWRTSLIYRVPLPLRLRPLLGVTMDAVGGKRRRDPEPGDVVSAAEQARELEAWGFFGAGALAGMELLLSERWSLGLNGRYLFTFNQLPSPLVFGGALNVVF